jgi:8-oxo-dGTP pyrophosphatase MutT (NUDIX family)
MADLKIDVKTYTRYVNGKAEVVPAHQSHHKEGKHPEKPKWEPPKHYEKVLKPLKDHPEYKKVWDGHKHWDSGPDYPAGSFVKPEPKPWTGPVHPQKDEHGKAVPLYNPTKPTGPETWEDPAAKATFVPGGKAPASLNGMALAPWLDHPVDPDDWDDVEGQDATLVEPELKVASHKQPAAGLVIEEPDGRVWVVHPSNMFAGYKRTFPKGHTETGINLQASAIKEAFEESGLKAEITGFLGDFERGLTTTRYYTARRTGGTPTDCGWESQAVSLVPKSMLYDLLNRDVDHPIAEAAGAGPIPKPKHLPEGDYIPKDDQKKPWWADKKHGPDYGPEPPF